MAKHIWEKSVPRGDDSRCWRCGWDKFLPVLNKLTDGAGRKVLCPNCTAILIAERELSFENDPKMNDDITGKTGAVEYMSGDERYVLECETMLRLLAHNLTKEEWKALTRKYGENQYMLHEDFYAEDGTALQPLIPMTHTDFK